MKLITFTGVDENTSIEKLKEITNKYADLTFKIEWGILLSSSAKEDMGRNRYPTVNFINNFLDQMSELKEENKCSLALHVCGKETGLLLDQSVESLALPFMEKVSRVQINTVFTAEKARKYFELLNKFKDVMFLSQENKKNHQILDLLLKNENKNKGILFDASGGRGILGDWEKPIEGLFCGYAGGLGVENIVEEIRKIKNLTNGNNYWVDMEGKIRTEDWFDLDKIDTILNLLRINKL